jgi:hypothetical protein
MRSIVAEKDALLDFVTKVRDECNTFAFGE